MRTCADFSGALRLLRHRPQDLVFPSIPFAVQEMGLSDTGSDERPVELAQGRGAF